MSDHAQKSATIKMLSEQCFAKDAEIETLTDDLAAKEASLSIWKDRSQKQDAEIARLRGLVEEAAKWENPDDNKYVADFINRARMAVSE